MFSVHIQIRDSALRLIRIIISYGLTSPACAIPNLVGVLVDENPIICESSFEELEIIESKYQTFFRSRIVYGLTLSFLFLVTLYNDNFNSINTKFVFDHTVYFSRLFTLIRPHIAARDAFLIQLMKCIDLEICLKSVGYEKSMQFYIFLIQILARLPYEFDEPIRIVRYLHNVINIKGTTVESSLKYSHSSMSSHDNVKAFNLYYEACRSSLAISSLIILCEYIRNLYQLTDESLEL